MTSRNSLDTAAEQEKHLAAARSLQDALENASLKLKSTAAEFHTCKLELADGEETILTDPAIVASDMSAQLTFLRKLKFQYLELNAKDKYVKTIVSDIDDAPMVTADDNRALAVGNEQKKEKLRDAKVKLAEVQADIHTLAPLVEEDHDKIRKATEKATILAQKIIDAKLALTRLRREHPLPRLTIPTANERLTQQVEQMQALSDETEALSKRAQDLKERVKRGDQELEKMRAERAEVEKAVKSIKVDEDDERLVPLYHWFTGSLALHRSIHNLVKTHTVSENELRLTYNVAPFPLDKPVLVTVCLIFAPDTRRLAAVHVMGLDEIDIDVGDEIESHVQTNDVSGLLAAVLSHVRITLSLRAV